MIPVQISTFTPSFAHGQIGSQHGTPAEGGKGERATFVPFLVFDGCRDFGVEVFTMYFQNIMRRCNLSVRYDALKFLAHFDVEALNICCKTFEESDEISAERTDFELISN